MINKKEFSYFKKLGVYIPKSVADKVKKAYNTIEKNSILPKGKKKTRKELSSEYYYLKKYLGLSSIAKAKQEKKLTNIMLSNKEKKILAGLIAQDKSISKLSYESQSRLAIALYELENKKRRKHYEDVKKALINMYKRKDFILPRIPNNSQINYRDRVLTDSEADYLKNAFKRWHIKEDSFSMLYGSE